MSPEFAPQAPEISRSESLDIKLEDSIRVYHELAKKRYTEALHIAEKIDDRMETSVPFNRNAVQAAMMLTFASLRGAENV